MNLPRFTRHTWFPTPQELIFALLLLTGALGFVQKFLEQQTRHTIVVTVRSIPAYTLLTAADLSTAQVATRPDAVLTDSAQAVGKITLTNFVKGAQLEQDQLLQPSRSVTNTLILRVPFSTTVAPAAGESLLLFGVDTASSQTSILVCDALVLGASDEQAIVLVTLAEAKAMARYWGQDGEIHVMRPVAHKVLCP